MNPTLDWTDKEWNKFSKWLKGMLSAGEVTVIFTKKDGTERVMRCTLETDKLPITEAKVDKKERKKSEDTIAVYDLDAKGWRSFTVKSVKTIRMEI